MKKYLLIALLSFALAVPVYASEVTGTLSTGISTGIEATVAATPTASPVAGTYTSAQSVTLTAAGSSSIRYTTDGSAPSCTIGTTYTGAIAVGSSLTIRAIGCYYNVASPVGIFAYGINIPPAPSGGGGGGGGGGPLPPSTPAAGNGDLNNDAVVNLLDFNSLVVAWGSTGSNVPADLNHDGVVDLLDFNLLIVNWTG